MDGKLIIGLGLGVIAGAMFLVWTLVQVYGRVDNPKVKDALSQLLYLLDEQCDHMEIPAKRVQVIVAIQALLGWRRLFLPSVVVGFVLDILVKALRKVGVPDLHQEVTESAGSNTGSHSDAG